MCWGKTSLSFLQRAIEKAGTVSALSELIGVSRQTIIQWQSGKVSPTLDKYGAVMNYLGATSVLCGQEHTEMVSFANVTFGGVTLPADDYIAVPVLRDPNLIDPSSFFTPQSNIHCYSLPVASYQSVRSRPNLIGVLVTDDSMAPLLEPGDVAYVDRADTAVHSFDRLYLVRDARSHEVCLRRVDIDDEDGDTMIHLTADSPKVRARHYSVKKHYGGLRRNCILGRVVYGRVDLLNL